MTVPSGGEFFRASTAIVPDAPVLLSISMLRPVRCFRASARKRAITSLPPPAGKPTRIFSDLSGRPVGWARTVDGVATAAAAIASVERRRVFFLFVSLLIPHHFHTPAHDPPVP